MQKNNKKAGRNVRFLRTLHADPKWEDFGLVYFNPKEAEAERIYKEGCKYEKEKSYYAASECYRDASGYEYIPAIYSLAKLLELGRGVDKNITEAKRLYTKAAEKDYYPAIVGLADLCGNGDPEVLDLKKADILYQHALKLAGKEDVSAVRKKYACFLSEKMPTSHLYRMADLWNEITKDKYAPRDLKGEAFYRLYQCYKNGTGVEFDNEKAVWCLSMAKELGNNAAKQELQYSWFDLY